MLFFRRLYAQYPARQLVLCHQKKNTKHKKATKLNKEIMENKCCSSYSKFRNWQHAYGVDKDQSNKFKLVSYNILSQDLLLEHMQLYAKIEPAFLHWDYRLKQLKAEILTLQPDILCLQEMQCNHLKNFIKAIDVEKKFEYVYKKKTGSRTDGCAIIYDKQKFRLLADYTIEYYSSPDGLLNRENVAIIAKFCTKGDQRKPFLVATTHLLFNPRREDVRVAQTSKLLSELENHCLEGPNRLPILLTGDFNFEPFSYPHKLISKQSLVYNQAPYFNSDNNYLTHSLQLSSALRYCNASTFQRRWVTVDYIFHSSNMNMNNIKIWSIYDLPSVELCQEMGSIPNKYLGSDHLCLAVNFSVENPIAMKV